MTAETDADYDRLCSELESQEIESPDGTVSPQVYGQLLAIYLQQNDLPNAKFLWKRIPTAVKTANPDLALIWAVGQKMWQRDIVGIYNSLNHDWSENIKSIMAAIRESTRQRMTHLIGEAYSSISADDLSKSMGLPVDDAIQAVLSLGWTADASLGIVMPCKQVSADVPAIAGETQLIRLTDYVSFLEN